MAFHNIPRYVSRLQDPVGPRGRTAAASPGARNGTGELIIVAKLQTERGHRERSMRTVYIDVVQCLIVGPLGRDGLLGRMRRTLRTCHCQIVGVRIILRDLQFTCSYYSTYALDPVTAGQDGYLKRDRAVS